MMGSVFHCKRLKKKHKKNNNSFCTWLHHQQITTPDSLPLMILCRQSRLHNWLTDQPVESSLTFTAEHHSLSATLWTGPPAIYHRTRLLQGHGCSLSRRFASSSLQWTPLWAERGAWLLCLPLTFPWKSSPSDSLFLRGPLCTSCWGCNMEAAGGGHYLNALCDDRPEQRACACFDVYFVFFVFLAHTHGNAFRCVIALALVPAVAESHADSLTLTPEQLPGLCSCWRKGLMATYSCLVSG